jgi:D-alanyl-D-alanine carboxypeptidase (penicillin-binding protein 5/6)
MFKRILAFLLPILLIAGYSGWAYAKPLPTLHPAQDISAVAAVTGAGNIAWSPYGEQAVGVKGAGVLATQGDMNPLPMASVAKVMVALAVLQQKPLQLNEQGPNVPITDEDVLLYQQYMSEGQSVAAVQVGEQLSEYQALQALLLPSGNNIATTLTNWAFGSQEEYLNYANNYAKSLGMAKTTFADASGFSPNTAATANDLVLMGQAAMENPVIAQIVGQYKAVIPVAGQITNVNSNINPASGSGLNGIKTGNTDQAGGCLLFSADFQGKTLVGAIMGAPNLGTALHDAPGVMASFKANVEVQAVVKAGEVVAHYTEPWGGRVNVAADKDLQIISFKGTKVPVTVSIGDISQATEKGKKVGTAHFTYNGDTENTPIKLDKAINTPSFWWRVMHPAH